MFTRRLGRSDLEVSALGMGCWAIGGPWIFDKEPAGWGKVDDTESVRGIQVALNAGINFFDTAANYGCGHSERLLGQALAGRRDKVIVATKFGYVVDEVNRVVSEAEDVPGRIRSECEASLSRLQTDYIDLYQLHKDDFSVERVGEVVQVLEALVDQGKIRWYGWSTDNVAGARAFALGEHCTAIQHWLNMGFDAPEMLKVCAELDQASIVRSPLVMGMLTGKFRPDTLFPEDDVRHGWNLQSERAAQQLERIEAVREMFGAAGDPRSLAQIALAWIWARSERTIPIPGFKTIAQVVENIEAMEFGPLGEEQSQRIDEIFGRTQAKSQV